ncbi:uncharacterized protein F4812DRAFT_334033 [Daldinia caldariorum]|uniref:uncharacterized protein n=1 Tax=Daldinia caldariorum TaxID=326644 RepID=UPI002008576F|nr:uncharacterized protein F4812DRAFT_334033 [Daldinia caldariorum]KAI1469540.1 hypothetical protein F4812DRAFT_334033 [Daldinia caldariorum]
MDIIELTDGDAFVPLRRRWLTKVFVTSNFVSLLFQSSDDGLMAVSDDSCNVNKNMIDIGLFVQLAFLSLLSS